MVINESNYIIKSITHVITQGNSSRKRRRCRSRSEGVDEHLLLGQRPPTGRQPRQSAPPASSPPHGGARETSGRRVKELIHVKYIVRKSTYSANILCVKNVRKLELNQQQIQETG